MVVSSMKKQSKIIVAVLAALFLAVAAMACVHFATREKVPVNTLAIHAGKELVYVDMDSFTLVPVQGTLVNELAIVGGVLIISSGLSILEIKDCKTLNYLPALLVPVLWFLVKGLFGL